MFDKNKLIKILHLEDLASDAELVERILVKGNINFEKLVVDTQLEFEKALKEFVPDVILSDHSLANFDSVQALKIVRDAGLDIPFILITATISEEFAVNAMKEGASDYIVKDRLQRLPTAICNAIEKKLAESEREKMITDIIQRSKNLEQFANIVSHDLRGPVANILGISNVLKGNLSDTDRNLTQSYLFGAVEHLDEIIKDLVKVVQLRSEIIENKELTSFSELVDSITSSIQNLIEKENVKIVTDFSAIDKIETLKGYLHSIFYNLISNSIKYRQQDITPIIEIKSEVTNNKVSILFKDNGTGIDLNLHEEKLFGLYKRFHPNIEGKGLGLFMVKTQVEVLGGTISAKSELNKGTEFIIELPV